MKFVDSQYFRIGWHPKLWLIGLVSPHWSHPPPLGTPRTSLIVSFIYPTNHSSIPYPIRYPKLKCLLACSTSTSKPTPTSPASKFNMGSVKNPEIILYTNHTCPWAHRAHIVLKELGLEFKSEIIDLSVPRTPEYLAINPRGLGILPQSNSQSIKLYNKH